MNKHMRMQAYYSNKNIFMDRKINMIAIIHSEWSANVDRISFIVHFIL